LKYSAEFRNPEVAAKFLESIQGLNDKLDKTISLMEVCGTHTMAIYRHGIRTLLPSKVRLTSGPGCPVCVTPVDFVDKAVALAHMPDVIVTTFGDMMRVPGSATSLLQEKAKGADVRIVYSPLDAVSIACKNPQRMVVFLGVGFETTAPTIAASILDAAAQEIKNFFVLSAHKTMPQAMSALTADPELNIDGYLCPAHVSTIIGANAYIPLSTARNIPCVITGFEPVDILQGIDMLVRQIVTNDVRVENQYSRFVRPEGNQQALSILQRVFEPCDARWRGLGVIPGSGLAIRDEYSHFDIEKQIDIVIEPPIEHAGCRCGEILMGKISPSDCPLFGTSCTPEEPVGACMVSSEGVCSAAYKYGDQVFE
jgi:hydrogenase expression/formation protein HypD